MLIDDTILETMGVHANWIHNAIAIIIKKTVRIKGIKPSPDQRPKDKRYSKGVPLSNI